MVAASYPTVVVAAVLCLGSTAIMDRGEQADSSRSHLLPGVARAPPKAGHQLHNVDRHVVFGAVEGPGGEDGGSGHEGGEGGLEEVQRLDSTRYMAVLVKEMDEEVTEGFSLMIRS